MEQTFFHHDLVQKLSESSFFKDYSHAFTETTGMDLSLIPSSGTQLETWESINQSDESCQIRFCSKLIESRASCTECMEFETRLLEKAKKSSTTEICPFGASESAIPITLSGEVIGFLKTGRVFVGAITSEKTRLLSSKLRQLGLADKIQETLKNMVKTPNVEVKQYQSALQILEFFAKQLTSMAEEIASRMDTKAPGFIMRAKQYIHERIGEDISLKEVASKVNTSSYYLCKQFKKATGLSYTEYVSKIRIQKAKRLLLEPEIRVSEVAFQVGFQSLTHFNRVFKKFTGQSPTEYRSMTEMAA